MISRSEENTRIASSTNTRLPHSPHHLPAHPFPQEDPRRAAPHWPRPGRRPRRRWLQHHPQVLHRLHSAPVQVWPQRPLNCKHKGEWERPQEGSLYVHDWDIIAGDAGGGKEPTSDRDGRRRHTMAFSYVIKQCEAVFGRWGCTFCLKVCPA